MFRKIYPYLGWGIGATHISARNADSLQVDPIEAGITTLMRTEMTLIGFYGSSEDGTALLSERRIPDFWRVSLFVCGHQQIYFWVNRCPRARTDLSMECESKEHRIQCLYLRNSIYPIGYRQA